MSKPGPRNSLTDVAGIRVGCAEDAAVRTGVTVIAPDAAAVTAVCVLGGGPGTRETDALAPHGLTDIAHAIVLSGGSVYGLGAADGVTAALGAIGRGFRFPARAGQLEIPPAPIVPAAILFDLGNGGDKAWGDAPPYARLGREAFAALSDAAVPLGNRGAGMGAAAGALKGGQGAASIVARDGVTVAALACVNAFGSAVMPKSRAFWAWPYEIDGEFGGVRPDMAQTVDAEEWGLAKAEAAARANTTLCLVATDATLTRVEALRVAQMASAGLARAIRPVFAPSDGDVVFAMATGARPLGEMRALAIARIGALAADCLARAISRGVYEATRVDARPAWRDLT